MPCMVTEGWEGLPLAEDMMGMPREALGELCAFSEPQPPLLNIRVIPLHV